MEATTLLAILTICVSVIIVAMKICFASKCEDVSVCFGLLSVHRAIELERTQFSTNNSPDTIQRKSDVLGVPEVLHENVNSV